MDSPLNTNEEAETARGGLQFCIYKGTVHEEVT